MSTILEVTTGIRSKLVIASYRHLLKQNERVLDIGCGDGILSAILQKKFALKLTGCDVDNYLKKRMPFVLMENPAELPFADNSFDTVMFNDVLHHTSFANQKNLLLEALRVADKVLIFEDEPTLIGSITDWSINKLHNLHMPVTLTFRNHKQWMDLFSELGFSAKYKKISKPIFYPFTHQVFSVTNE